MRIDGYETETIKVGLGDVFPTSDTLHATVCGSGDHEISGLSAWTI
jgi:hypothetical protein